MNHSVARFKVKVGEYPSLKWEWLHRMQCRNCGEGRNKFITKIASYEVQW
jgi:hypothetical protein